MKRVRVKEVTTAEPPEMFRSPGKYQDVEKAVQEAPTDKWVRIALDNNAAMQTVMTYIYTKWEFDGDPHVLCDAGDGTQTLYLYKSTDGTVTGGTVSVKAVEYREPPRGIKYASKFGDVVIAVAEAEMQRWLGLNLGDITQRDAHMLRQKFYGSKNHESLGFRVSTRLFMKPGEDTWLYVYKHPLEI